MKPYIRDEDMNRGSIRRLTSSIFGNKDQANADQDLKITPESADLSQPRRSRSKRKLRWQILRRQSRTDTLNDSSDEEGQSPPNTGAPFVISDMERSPGSRIYIESVDMSPRGGRLGHDRHYLALPAVSPLGRPTPLDADESNCGG